MFLTFTGTEGEVRALFSRLYSRFVVVEGCTGSASKLFTQVVKGVDTLAVLRCVGCGGRGPVNQIGCTLFWFHRQIVVCVVVYVVGCALRGC